MTPTLCVNFYGGPGAGKSTTCAHAFAKLKWKGINCEMALEYAKEIVWDNALGLLDNQLSLFGQQYHRIHRLLGKVDIILTDSPLPLSLIYGRDLPQEFKSLVIHQAQQLHNLNIFLLRQKRFNPAGRIQNEEQSIEKDHQIRTMLETQQLPYLTFAGEEGSINDILRAIDLAYGTMRKRTDKSFYLPEESYDV